MRQTRAIAALSIVAVLGGCGLTEDEPSGREINTDCRYYKEVHQKFWRAYNEPKPPPLSPEEKEQLAKESNERLATEGSGLRYDPETGLPVGVIPMPKPTNPEVIDRRLREKAAYQSQETTIRNWPHVNDATLQYLMKEMAEATSTDVFLRNFVAASSYCDLPDQPTASK